MVTFRFVSLITLYVCLGTAVSAVSEGFFSSLPYPLAYSSSFLYPTLTPGQSSDNKLTVVDTHCTGNGRSVVCVSANTTESSVTLVLRRSDAQGSAGDVLTISSTKIYISPNPFLLNNVPNNYISYNQTLDMLTASILITAGGDASATNYALQFLVYVTTCDDLNDASQPCDTVRVLANTNGANSSLINDFQFTVQATSVRPPTQTVYDISYSCYQGSSMPDVFVDNGLLANYSDTLIMQYHRNDINKDISVIDTVMRQQQIENMIPYIADMWTNLTFGVGVTGTTNCTDTVTNATVTVSLNRTSSDTLVSVCPTTENSLTNGLDLRLVLYLNQTEDEGTFINEFLQAVSVPDISYADHCVWWNQFWNRSKVEVRNAMNLSPPSSPSTSISPRTTGTASSTTLNYPPIANGLLLWLAADNLPKVSNGAAIATWPDASGNGNDAIQTNTSAQPTYTQSSSFTSLPAVTFDGTSAYLENTLMNLPALNTTILAVFTDTGSTTTCCSGIFYGIGNCRGISTTFMPSSGQRLLLTDWCYSLDPHGRIDLTNKLTLATVQYTEQSSTNSSSVSTVNGCLQTHNDILPGASGTGFMIGSRNAELGRYFKGEVSEILVYNSSLSPTDISILSNYLETKWNIPQNTPDQCPATSLSFAINYRYAAQRFMNAIQSRGTHVPIRFNGQLFIANLPPYTDDRLWGTLFCHQNVRLAYVAQLGNGDYDLHRTYLDYLLDRVPLQRIRTQQFFQHDGIHWTECLAPIGTPSSKHYDQSCTNSSSARPPTLPYWEVDVDSGNRFEYGGDGGTPEIGMVALDHFYYTNDYSALEKYLPLASLAAVFYDAHYPRDNNGTGNLRITPTGVLEFYWCWTNGTLGPGQPSDCCENDLPTVAGLTKLLDSLLAFIPSNMTNTSQRENWQRLRNSLPPLPTTTNTSNSSLYPEILAPAEVMCTAGDNQVESPSMYSVYPYRLYTVAKSLVPDPTTNQTANLTIAVNSFLEDPHASSSDYNHDWCQGIFDAALLGLVNDTVRLLTDRVFTPPAPGYRWEGFAPAIYDYAPVSELYAGVMSAVNYMLLQPGDDTQGTMVVFPTWPCDWDVSFSLWGPYRTRIDLDYEGGVVTALQVTPPERAKDIVWASCVSGERQKKTAVTELPGRIIRKHE